jgi:hypothetical protein
MSERADLPTEPERIPARMIAVVAAGMLIAIALSVVAVWLLAGRAHGGGVRDVTPPAEIHAIDTPTFGRALDAERTRAAQRDARDRWLDAAIDRYLAAHGGAR